MVWPIASDYFEAIQNPTSCFSDAELRSGFPPMDPKTGLPRYGNTGAFASVYQIDCFSRRWAARCFLRQVADQERRYNAISSHLRSVKLPCMVGFDYLRQGIQVRGKWYPLLKMDWTDGTPLNEYVAQIRFQPSILKETARQWMDLLAALRSAGIAHGDLQHGNVLVRNGIIRLIDYDGMYVPALIGMQSNEEGHRHYQHPCRTSRDFGKHLDNFSAWVIYLSLSALAIDPQLWNLLGDGDDHLLFRREDYAMPLSSKAFRLLSEAKSRELNRMAECLRSLLSIPLSQIPPLDNAELRTRLRIPSPSRTTAKQTGLPEWIRQESRGLPDWIKSEEVRAKTVVQAPTTPCTRKVSLEKAMKYIPETKTVFVVLMAVLLVIEGASDLSTRHNINLLREQLLEQQFNALLENTENSAPNQIVKRPANYRNTTEIEYLRAKLKQCAALPDEHLGQFGVEQIYKAALAEQLKATLHADCPPATLDGIVALVHDCEVLRKRYSDAQQEAQATRARDYQRWALEEINAFKTADDAIQSDVETEDSKHWIGWKPGWQDKDFRRLCDAMARYLLPINTALLEPPVMVSYSQVYQQGWNRLRDQERNDLTVKTTDVVKVALNSGE